MIIELNQRALEFAEGLVKQGKFVADQKDNWSEDKPSTQEENKYLDEHGFGDYGKWYLGINTEAREATKERYEFPYGDFTNVHRCGVLSAESRAGQYKHFDVEKAAAHLKEMIDTAKQKSEAH